MSDSIIFIVGPTAVGKSEIALQVAQQLKAEIVSCDAMQVYREINVASAKPSSQDLALVPHHALNLVSVTENFDVATYNQHATAAINAIHKAGKKVIVVGGSGMYMSVLLDGIFVNSNKDEALRASLQADIEKNGTAPLHARLKALDPKAASKIHTNDPQRIIRALEVALTSVQPISELQSQRQGLWGKHSIKIFALNRPRAELYERVEARIENMFKSGLIEEIEKINKLVLSSTAKTLMGIPEVQGYLAGDYDIERAKYLMKLHTRHYVKRQLTWFRRDERIQWMDVDAQTVENIINQIS